MANKEEIPAIVKRAIVDGVCNIGQLSGDEVRTLDRYVRKGWLSKGRGGPYPKLKTMWARPGFDFGLDRQRHVRQMMQLADLDRRAGR